MATSDSSRTLLEARGLHVVYLIGSPYRLRNKWTQTNPTVTQVSALKGVNLKVEMGDRIGIMGENGSGKSTLLRALAGLLPIEAGTIRAVEEPKLLGVGAMLLPDATGLENARLGLLALGVAKNDLQEAVREVVEFSELGTSISRPIRTYSSGMMARLHFSIATQRRPKILLVDEALAVGDKNFRVKSTQRIHELVQASGAFVLVNHSMSELKAHCSRGVWLQNGRLEADGPIESVSAMYESA